MTVKIQFRFYLSKIYDIDIDTVLSYGEELKNLDFIGGVANPVKVCKLDDSITSQFDSTVLDGNIILDNYDRGRRSAKGRNINDFDSFLKN